MININALKKLLFGLVILLSVPDLNAQEEPSTNNLNNQLKIGFGSSSLLDAYFLSYESQTSRFVSSVDLPWLMSGFSLSYSPWKNTSREISYLGLFTRNSILIDELLKETLPIMDIIQPYAGAKFGYVYLIYSDDDSAVLGGLTNWQIRLYAGINVNLSEKLGFYFELGGEEATFNAGINIR